MGQRKPSASASAENTLRTIRHASGALFVTLTDAVTGASARLSFPTIEAALGAEMFLAILARAIPETPMVVLADTVAAPAVVAVTPRRKRASGVRVKVGVAA